MTIKELRRIHQLRPFQPFTLHLADGRAVEISHPEFLLAPPVAERTVIAATPEGEYEVIDLLLVTSIRMGNGKSKRRRGRHDGRYS